MLSDEWLVKYTPLELLARKTLKYFHERDRSTNKRKLYTPRHLCRGVETTKCIAQGVNNKEKYFEIKENVEKMYIFQQFILQLYGVWICCYLFQMRVSKRYRMLFTAEKYHKFC